MKRLALIGLVALLVASAAAAATPSTYRANVNGICRGYTPALSKLAKQIDQIDSAKDYQAWTVAVGKFLTLELAEYNRVEAVSVPASLREKMKPILVRMQKIDSHARAALGDAKTGNAKAMISELLTIGELETPLIRALGAVGLKDCAAIQS
jgi:hypothetical protein